MVPGEFPEQPSKTYKNLLRQILRFFTGILKPSKTFKSLLRPSETFKTSLSFFVGGRGTYKLFLRPERPLENNFSYPDMFGCATASGHDRYAQKKNARLGLEAAHTRREIYGRRKVAHSGGVVRARHVGERHGFGLSFDCVRCRIQAVGSKVKDVWTLSLEC